MNFSNLSTQDAVLMQSGLKALGFYNGTTRGRPGPLTKKAYNKYLESKRARQPFGDALARVAMKEVGNREVGHNGGSSVRKYQRATWLNVGDWPWCAAFVCWCFKEALKTSPQVIQRPTTPGAWKFEKWAEDQGAELLKLLENPKTNTKVRKGDIVVYTFSHIGIAIEDERDGLVYTVEGNTNSSGDREGDGVYRKTRRKAQIRSIIRL